MKSYICKYCGHEVIAEEKPQPMRWTDGHICRFVLFKKSCWGCGRDFEKFWSEEDLVVMDSGEAKDQLVCPDCYEELDESFIQKRPC